MKNLKVNLLILGKIIALILIGSGIFQLAFMVLPAKLLHSLIVGGASYLLGKSALTHINIPNTLYNKIKGFLLG